MNNEMFTQEPIFNTEYFPFGRAVRLYDNQKGKIVDGLILSREKDRLGIVIVEWYSPITGTARYEAKSFYLNIKDVLNKIYDIDLL